jgi:hypothetical protein
MTSELDCVWGSRKAIPSRMSAAAAIRSPLDNSKYQDLSPISISCPPITLMREDSHENPGRIPIPAIGPLRWELRSVGSIPCEGSFYCYLSQLSQKTGPAAAARAIWIRVKYGGKTGHRLISIKGQSALHAALFYPMRWCAQRYDGDSVRRE